jgi:hypothetical protein
MRNSLVALAAGIVGWAGAAIGAAAQDLPQTTIRFVGNTSSSYIWTEAEKTFIDKTFPEASKGRVKIEGVPHDQAGLRGPEILSLLQNGTLQFASYSVSYMAGDDPRFEGIDLAGLDADRCRRAQGRRRLSAGRRAADEGEVRGSAAGTRAEPGAGLLVPHPDRRHPGSQGQEDPRLQSLARRFRPGPRRLRRSPFPSSR